MSNNQKQQDAVEHTCLNFVIKNLNRQDSFGLTEQQYEQLKELLTEVKPNPNSNIFPDFISDNGFIEHFTVTSSTENKKGSTQKRESSLYRKESLEKFEEISKENDPTVYIINTPMKELKGHRYINILNSIKQNWEKHVESYDKSITSLNKGVFLIEYTDIMINTAFSVKYGSEDIYDTYRITGDTKLLEWIYKYRNKINYLIFVNLLASSIEIVNIGNIPKVIKKTPNAWYDEVQVAFESHKFLRIF